MFLAEMKRLVMKKWFLLFVFLFPSCCWAQDLVFQGNAMLPMHAMLPMQSYTHMGVPFARDLSSPPSRRVKIGILRQPQVTRSFEPVVFWAIGTVFGGISLLPLIGNVYAVTSGAHRDDWGGTGLAAVGFLGCMAGYTALAHGNFVGKNGFVYAMIPSFVLWGAIIALSVSNLML